MLSTKKSNPDHHVKWFELFHLIWLDDEQSEKNENIAKKLRSVTTHFNKFQDVTKCRRYIKDLPADHRVILIVNDRLGNELISMIDQFAQVLLICIYDGNNSANEQSFDQFGKVI